MKLVLMFITMFMVGNAYAVNAGSASGNKGIQVQEFTYDFAVDGGAIGNIDISHGHSLPVNAQILNVYWDVDTAFTSGGSATVGIGDSTTTARYKALTAYNNSAYSAASLQLAAIGTPVAVAVAATGKPNIGVSTAALTAGKMKLIYVYYMPKQ